MTVIGGAPPGVPALARSKGQPVPYLEAERLLLSSLSAASRQKMLQTPLDPEAHAQRRHPQKKPLPEWYDKYMQAALQAEAADAVEDLTTLGLGGLDAAAGTGASVYSFVACAALQDENRPLGELDQRALQAWWMGDQRQSSASVSTS